MRILRGVHEDANGKGGVGAIERKIRRLEGVGRANYKRVSEEVIGGGND